MSAQGYLDLMDLGRLAASRNEFALARERFQQALAVKPDAAEALYAVGTVSFLLRDFPAAKDCFERVLGLDASHAGALVNLGALANLRGEFDDAVKHLRRVIQIDPRRSDAYYNLGISYRKLGRNELAIQAYREAHRHNPRMAEAVCNLANIYLEMERYDQAATHYRKALEINPAFAKAREGLELVERRLRPKNEEIEELPGYRGVVDPYAGDPRLDRTLDPERDYEPLIRLHNETQQLKTDADQWLASTARLDQALRDLSIAMTGGSIDASTAFDLFQAAAEDFRAVTRKVETSRAAVGVQRDALVARG